MTEQSKAPKREARSHPAQFASRGRRGPQLVGGAVLGLAVALLVINGLWVGKSCGSRRLPKKGSLAPGFELRTLGGQAISLVGLRGKVVVLDFWATWCPPCVKKYPDIEALQDELGARGLRVIAISFDRDRKRLERFVAGRAALRVKAGRPKKSITVALADRRVAAAYGVNTLPHVVLVDRRGRLRYVRVGRGGAEALRAAALRALVER